MNTKKSREFYSRMVKSPGDARIIFHYIYEHFENDELYFIIREWIVCLPDGVCGSLVDVPLTNDPIRVSKWFSRNLFCSVRVSEKKKFAAALKVITQLITRCSKLFGDAISLREEVDWEFSVDYCYLSLKRLVYYFKYEDLLFYLQKAFLHVVEAKYRDSFKGSIVYAAEVSGNLEEHVFPDEDSLNSIERHARCFNFCRSFLDATYFYFNHE